MDEIWNGLFQRISAHFLDNYQKLIAELRQDA